MEPNSQVDSINGSQKSSRQVKRPKNMNDFIGILLIFKYLIIL